MSSAQLGKLSRAARRPWYLAWKILDRTLYSGRDYTLHIPSGQRVLTPWFGREADPDFAYAIKIVNASGRRAVAVDRCYVLFHLAGDCIRQTPSVPVAECGVYSGTTAQVLCLARQFQGGTRATVHLFDTFQGMPDTSVPDRDYHRPGDFADTSLQSVKDRLADFPSVEFHQGLMPDTFDSIADIDVFSFVHVDVDIYPSTRACLEHFWPKLRPGGAVVVDDYGFYPYRYAARRAVDEYFADKPERPWVLPTGQGVIFKDSYSPQDERHEILDQ